LAARTPFNSEISVDAFKRAEHAEEFIGSIGASFVRARDEFPLARIELLKDEFDLIKEEEVVSKLKELGHGTMTWDLDDQQMRLKFACDFY